MRTITSLFDSRNEAEAARQRLIQSDIEAERVRIVDQNSAGASEGEERGFWASLREAFLPEDDGHAYEEGMRRGGYLLCAQVHESQANAAIDLLEGAGSVDFDARQTAWRNEGWEPRQSHSNTASSHASSAVEEQRVPIVEEELRVGKREVARGGARVRSYVSETPVHEEIGLREEHVSVERRPVDERLTSDELERGDLLRGREIEMTERSEEAVVGKEARVREELVLKKTTTDRVEQVDDTVRRTEVEVDENVRGSETRAFGFRDNGGHAPGSGGTGDRVDSERPAEGAGHLTQGDKRAF
jgi:uncharacterized protein (TIGR02271 family)